MYVKVLREHGAAMVVKLEDNVRRFQCDDAEITKFGPDDVVHTKCACCERRLVVMLPDRDPTDKDVAYLKGGRPH